MSSNTFKNVILKDILVEKGYIRGPFGSALKRNEMCSKGIPVYEQQNAIYDNRIFRYFIDDEKYQELKRFTTIKDDLIISCSGTVGKVSIIKENDPKGIISQALLTLRVNKDIIFPEYLKYFFMSYEGYNSLVSRSTGSVQINISKKAVIEQIPLKIPSLEIQKKIIYILSNLDKKIKINQEINHHLELELKIIFNSWFFNFDIFNKEELIDSEFGLIPKIWRICSLGEITTRIKNKVGNSNYKVLSAVNTGKLELSEEYFNKQVFSKNIKKYLIVNENEFAYNPARVNIGSIGINDLGFIGCVSPAYIVFKVEKGYENFINMFIKTSRFNKEVALRAYGSVRQSLKYDDFALIQIVYPTKEYVKKFNSIYKCFHQIITYNNTEIKKLTKIRDTLLPKLMSGEIDVSKIEI